MKPVSVIGMGLSPQDMTSAHLDMIRAADILIGGKRHLDFFRDFRARQKEITKDIKGIIAYIRTRMEKESVVVLASGDPLFFGIGTLLVKSLGAEHVDIYPNITSVAAAFSRIREPWHDAHVVSIHGRFCEASLLRSFANEDTIAVLTDPVKNPAWLAGFLLENWFADFRMCVLEQLGSSSEKVGWYDLPDAVGRQFSDPNVVILKRTDAEKSDAPLHIGMPNASYEHQKSLITKPEVRAVTISKLCLFSSDHTLWDLGAGSGSISIEASLFLRQGRVIAVEQNAERVAQIRKNKERFQVRNLEVVHEVLPEGLENLPKPDRVFIGGGGKNLKKIIHTAADHLSSDGIMVINTVLLQNMEAALGTLRAIGFKTEIIQVQISQGREMPWGERLEAQNPIWVIQGSKKCQVRSE